MFRSDVTENFWPLEACVHHDNRREMDKWGRYIMINMQPFWCLGVLGWRARKLASYSIKMDTEKMETKRQEKNIL